MVQRAAVIRYDDAVSSGRTHAEQVASALLDHARLSDADAARRIANARDASYWRALVSDGPGAVETASSAVDVRAACAHLRDEGYFQTPPILRGDALARCNQIVDAVVAAGWPPVFAWIYDEIWQCTRLPEVQTILTSALGAGYLHIPHPWIHEVPAVAGASGWSPHFDGRGRARASVWIALSDATLANGCMHVVPRPALAASFGGDWAQDGRSVPIADAVRALHAARALPVERGSALGWTFDVLHWGGSVDGGEAQPARRSISMEFIAAGEPPQAHETPLLDARGALPAFAARVPMIARALGTYEHFEPRLARWRGVAAELA